MLLGYTYMILGCLLYIGGFAAAFIGCVALANTIGGGVGVIGAIVGVISIVLGMAVSSTVYVALEKGSQRVWRRGQCHFYGSSYGEYP